MKHLPLVLILLLTACAEIPVKSPSEIAVEAGTPTETTTPAPVEVKTPSLPVIETPDPLPSPTVPAVPEVVVKPLLNVEVKSLTGFSKSQDARFRKIAARVQEIVNSASFKEKILGWTYAKKKQFVSTKDSNEQVFAKVTAKKWSLEYRLEYIAKKPFQALTIGYTYPTVSWIVINSKIFDTYADKDIAANICHEAGGHKFGRYDHTSEYTKARPYSVPYALGDICEALY